MTRAPLSSFFLALLAVALVFPQATVADTASGLQTQIDANNQQLQAIQDKIASYQKQLETLGTERNTLQSAISALTLTQEKISAQIQETQTKISSANLQIKKLTQSISNKEDTILADQNAIGKQLRTLAQDEQTPLVAKVLSSDTFGAGWQLADEAVQFNQALVGHISNVRTVRATLQANRTDVTTAKATLVSLQSDLTNQKRSVNASKAAEQELLAQTKNQEANYQKLLAAAKAELESYSAFTQNAGGSKLLTNQTVCDSWGCYYNQRDALWGNMPLNKTRFRLASDGCLVTAMAMMLTHYGYRSVTPAVINADSNNFATYYPPYLLFTIHVAGVAATRKATTIDATLESGQPVVVGVHAYGGTHFVVLTSGSRGSYLMRDPYIANGRDISFSAHYSTRAIFSITRVVISS